MLVLTEFVRPLIQFHNRVFKTNIKFEDFYDYRNFHNVWGGTPEECIKSTTMSQLTTI